MAFNFPGSATVNVSGNVTSVPSYSALTIISGGAGVIGTVPANKRWRIVYIQGAVATTTGTSVYSTLTASTSGLLMTTRAGDASGTPHTGHLVAVFNLEACPVLVAGETLTVADSANTTGQYIVGYIQESV